MKVQHVSKSKQTIPGVGETDEHGVIDVADELAGRPPAPRIAEALAELNVEPRLPHEEAVRLKDEIGKLDYGSGLLAQDSWRPFGKVAKEALKEDDK